MIRIIGNRLIITRGETASFSLPSRGFNDEGDIAVFSVKDPLTQETVIEKIADAAESHLVFFIEHEDTCRLAAKKYSYDIKIFRHPSYDIETGKIIDAREIDSYYGLFKTPIFQIKESCDNI